MIYNVTFEVRKDGDVFSQNFYVECELKSALFDAIKTNMELVDGAVDNIHILQYLQRQKFEKRKD